MDNLTHILSGALLGAALTPDDPTRAIPTRTRVLLAAIATNVPDLDYAAAFVVEPLATLNLHRGITHSFLFAPLLGLALAAIAHQLTARRYRLRDLWLIATLALLLHAGLDLLTSYGTQIFAPFSERPFALPVLFIIDPLVWLLLGTACALAWRRRSTLVARNGLLALGAYAVFCGGLMVWAERAADAYATDRHLERSVLALPQPLSPFHWKLVVVDGDEYHTSYLNLIGREQRPEPDETEGFLARIWAAYQPADGLRWRKRHRYGDERPMRGFAKHAFKRDELYEFRRFALLPQLYALSNRGPDAGCGWFTDLRFESPALASPFRYGICHGPVDGRFSLDRGWTLETDGAPPLTGR